MDVDEEERPGDEAGEESSERGLTDGEEGEAQEPSTKRLKLEITEGGNKHKQLC